MDVMQSISFDDLPVAFQFILYFCGGCLLLVLVGLCIIAVIYTFTVVITFFEDIIDNFKMSKEGKKDE